MDYQEYEKKLSLIQDYKSLYLQDSSENFAPSPSDIDMVDYFVELEIDQAIDQLLASDSYNCVPN